jgi:hypothetical protein
MFATEQVTCFDCWKVSSGWDSSNPPIYYVGYSITVMSCLFILGRLYKWWGRARYHSLFIILNIRFNIIANATRTYKVAQKMTVKREK